MRGLFLNKPGDLELKQMQSPRILEKDEVKIKLIYGGICGTDLRVFHGEIDYASYPIRPGHELVGEIIEVGGKALYPIGMRVVIQPNSYCGECDQCSKGKKNICLHKRTIGVNVDGGFSEQFVISSKYVLPIPEELSNERAVLIEPFSVVVHAFKKVNIVEGSSVAVIGCGTEGMLAVMLANYLGANVTAIDINQEKLDKIKTFGKIKTLKPQDLKEEKFDVVFEAAGVRASVEQALQIVDSGGSVVLIGIVSEASLPVVRVVRSEITLYGTIIYDYPADFLQSIEYLMQDDFDVQPIIAEIIPFMEYERAYKEAISGKHGKVILDFR